MEVEKEHVKLDLCSLQTEIQGNEKAVKSLQQTMDRLQKSKQKLNKVHEARTISIQVSTLSISLFYYCHTSFIVSVNPSPQSSLEMRIQLMLTVHTNYFPNNTTKY